MGACCGGDPVNSQINNNLSQKFQEERVIRKLLLLGSGSAGKSTIVKQLNRIHQSSLGALRSEQTTITIQNNCIQCIIALLKNATLLYERNKQAFCDCFIDIEGKPQLVDDIKFVLENKDLPTEIQFKSDINVDDEISVRMKRLGKIIAELWKMDAIKKTYSVRGSYFSFIENMDYFFNKAEMVMDFSYVPSDEDIVYSRERTIGITESTFSMHECQINIVDVGGQRNERAKWIHAFDNVDAIIFVAALNHYNVVLFEDETVNAMHESLQLFIEITSGKWFAATELILFLNKRDLFEKELRCGHSLSICFGERAFEWKGPEFWTEELKKEHDFDPNSSKANDPAYFEACFRAALAFVQDLYVQRNAIKNRQMYTHVTCATDKDNVEKVFWDVQDIVIRSGLRRNNIL